MRIGVNPIHKKNIITRQAYHRVIIPVYIPELNGYYKDSFIILKLCIESLIKTIHKNTLVTIINNASHENVSLYLRELIAQRKIDQLIEYQENKGKVDPLIAVMRGCCEELITLSDADILFNNGWQHAVEELFYSSPYVGMVSPLPIPSLKNAFSPYSWFWGMFNCTIFRYNNFVTTELEYFYKSIGRKDILTDFDKYPIAIKLNGIIGIIGAGHFCATFHRKIIDYIPNISSGIIFKGAEEKFLDEPVVRAGMMRLSTSRGYIYHMGNTMIDNYNILFNQIRDLFNPKNSISFTNSSFQRKSFNSVFVKKLFSNKRFISFILRFYKNI